MLLHPPTITFGDLTLDNVLAVAIERTAAREVVDFTDLGPHIAFADVPEQRIALTVIRRPSPPELASLQPGAIGPLAFAAAQSAADAHRIRITARVMLREVRYDLTDGSSGSTPRAAPRQSLHFLAISPDGLADPITIETV